MSHSFVLRYARLTPFVRRHFRTLVPFLTPRKALNVALALLEMQVGRTLLRSRPFMFRIDPYSLCNLRCPSCVSHSAVTDERRLMSLDDFCRVIDKIKQVALRASLYDMGEPLLNKDIYQMIDYVTRNRISTLISTNFNLFRNSDLDSLFSSGLTVLEPCLDGISQEAYATYRVNGDVELVKSGIRSVMDEKRRRGSRYPIVDVQVVLFRHIQHEYDQIARFCEDTGVDKLTYRQQIGGFEAESKVHLAQGSVKAEAFHHSTGHRRCFWLYLGMMIRPDGSVYPCCGRGFDRFAYGNIYAQSLDDLWNNDYYQFSRALFQAGPDLAFDERMNNLPCLDCRQFRTRRSMKGHHPASRSTAGFAS